MSLLGSLPAPARVAEPPPAREVVQSKSAAAGPRAVREVPPYGRRRGFVPRRLEDFGDGGAFPEIHVAQYPRNMGRADKQGKASDGKTLALTVNADGELNYDAILRAGQRKDKVIFSKHDALVPKVDDVHQTDQRPDREEIHESTKETWNALQRLVDSKIQAAQPKTLPAQPGPAEYIKYTPSQTGSAFNSGASTRIIRMQDLPVDPLEPPKFRHKKVPRGAGSPPVPVMHSPPRPLTVKDQQDWKIPPCISNWKNPKGYTIPLDKRLAADGRGMQEMQVNDNFAALSAALYTAENEARREVEIANRMKQEQAKRRKEQKEKELRELALKARMERYGQPQAGPAGAASRLDDEAEPARAGGDDHAAPTGGRAREREQEEEEEEHAARSPRRRGRDDDEETAEERRERKQRDQFREERRRERERERRLEAKDAQGFKRSKLTRDRDRDISERVALGQANVTGTGQVVYDSRLFNQDQGMAAGFGSEDAYNLYDKPLFADRGGVFKPSSRQDDDAYGGGRGGEESVRTSKFKPDQGFSGTDAGGAPRSEPVQFERNEAEADPFGLDQFLSDVKSGSKQQRQRR